MTNTPNFARRPLATLCLSACLAIGLSACKGSAGDAASNLQKAQASIAANDLASAHIQLKNAIQAAPENGQARFLLGKLLLEEGRLLDAEKELRRALELNFDNEQLAEPLLESVLRTAGFDKLKETTAKLKVSQASSKGTILSLYGQAYLGDNKISEAQEAFTSALAADPSSVAARVGLSKVMASKGDVPGALAAAKALVNQAPKDYRSHLLLADMMIANGQGNEIEPVLKQAVSLRPRDPLSQGFLTRFYLQSNNLTAATTQLEALEKVAGGQPSTVYLRAALHYLRKELPQARDLMQAVNKVMPDFAPGNLLSAQIALDMNELTIAEQFAKQALANASHDPRGTEMLGAIYLKMGAPERALATVKPLIDAGYKDFRILEIAAQAATQTRDVAGAQSILSTAVNQSNASEEAKVALALSKASTGESNLAISQLEAITKSAPANSDKATLALISVLLSEKQYDRALNEANALAKKFPQNPIPPHTIGEILAAKGDTAGARASFMRALDITPNFLPSLNAAADLDLQQGKKDAARAHFDKVLQKEPKNADALLALGRILAAGAGTPAQALEAHRAAKAAAPTAMEPGLALAQYLMNQGQHAESITLLEEMRQTRPNELAILDLLAAANARSGNRTRAMEVLDSMLKINPSSAAIYYRIGDLRASLDDYPGAIAAFNKASELQPKNLESRAALASLYLRMGKKAEAKTLITQLNNEAPKSAMIAMLVGDTALADKQYPDAITAYRRGLGLQKSSEIARKLHLALNGAGQEAEADKFLREWWAANPQDLGIMMQAGQMKMDRAQWKEAVAIFGAVLKVKPDIAPALNNMAWSLHQLQDKNAKPLAQKALSLEPKSHVIMDTLGVITVDQGDLPKGVELLRSAISAAPTSAEYRVHLARALIKVGDKAGAISEVERVLRERPEDPAANEARELRKQLAR
jgi:cellulose synthase operon protein C